MHLYLTSSSNRSKPAWQYVLVLQDPTLSNDTTAGIQAGWPTAATRDRWTRLAPLFAGMPHVIFGVVNEPQANWDGAYDTACWSAMNAAVAAIRAAEAAVGDFQHLVAVQARLFHGNVSISEVTRCRATSRWAPLPSREHPFEQTNGWN